MEPIAVVGMGAIFPDSMNLSEYWSNILASRNSVRELPDQYWLKDDYYDSDKSAPDKSYSKIAGVVGNIEFDSLEFGITPVDLESISVDQIFALVVAKQALQDAGLYGENAKEFDRGKVGVIVAAGIGKTAFSLHSRLQIPKYRRILLNSGVSEKLVDIIIKKMSDIELEWTEQSNPGYLANVVAGRIASRFDLYGVNFSVDAACASSLAAVKCAVNELQTGNCDIVLTGGVNLDCSEFSFVSFCKTPAISPSGKIRPFDRKGDGMILGDGVGMMVLKRLSMAEKDGDRIYGVIKGIGAAGDGKSKGIFSPNVDGQIRTLDNAYKNAGISASSISLIEAHGTGTKVGDNFEIEALDKFFKHNDISHKIGIGSVKSQIGHTRMTAGAASLIKVLLSLHHKVMPATINVDEPTEFLKDSMISVLQNARPWIVSKVNPIRRAGVSAFGFGGTNYHVVLEEYGKDCEKRGKYRINSIPVSVVVNAESKAALLSKCNDLCEKLINDLTFSVNNLYGERDVPIDDFCVGFVVYDREDAVKKLKVSSDLINEVYFINQIQQIDGIYFRRSERKNNKIAVVIDNGINPYVRKLKDISLNFPEMRNSLRKLDNACIRNGKAPISDLVYPYGTNDIINGADIEKASSAFVNGVYKILKNRGLPVKSVICRNKFYNNAKYLCDLEKESICYKESKKTKRSKRSEYRFFYGKKQYAESQSLEKCLNKAIDKDINTFLVIGNSDLKSVSDKKVNIISLFADNSDNDLYELENSVLQLRLNGIFIERDIYSDMERFERRSMHKHIIEINPIIYRNHEKEKHLHAALKCDKIIVDKNDNEEKKLKVELETDISEVKTKEKISISSNDSNNVKDNAQILKNIKPTDKEKTDKKTSVPNKNVSEPQIINYAEKCQNIEINSIEVSNYLKQQTSAFNLLVNHLIKGANDINLAEKIETLKEISNNSTNSFISLIDKQNKSEGSSLKPVKLHTSGMRRLQLELKEAVSKESGFDIKKGTVIVLIDGYKDESVIFEKLKADGFSPIKVFLGGLKNNSAYSVNYSDEKNIEEVIDSIIQKSKKGITGFIFISDNTKNNDIRKSVEIAKTVYFFAKYFKIKSDRSLTEKQRKFFINILRMDGKLGLDGNGKQTVLGGLMGLSKSLFYEWQEDTIVKGIDIHPSLDDTTVSDYIMNEIHIAQNIYPELGIDFDGTKRYISLKEHDKAYYGNSEPTKDDVILVTGGGKGITAKCIVAMAQKYKCKFILLGRTALTDNVDDYMNTSSKREIQDLLIKKMRLENKMLKPAELSNLVNNIYSQTTIRKTISELEEYGSIVLYYTCNINDGEQVRKNIIDAERKLGTITGFIHGAGVLSDKLINNITEKDFDTVVKTKIYGLDSCLKNIDFDKLKYLIMFSSIAAFFGNKGQSNYALANEIMNKISFYIKKHYPKCIVSAINWGPWDYGMIDASLREAFKARDISILSVERGVEIFIEQFLYEQQYLQSQIVVFDKMYF